MPGDEIVHSVLLQTSSKTVLNPKVLCTNENYEVLTQNIVLQECIPVGCVPAARQPYAVVCFPGGGSASGVSAPGGGSASGGVCSRGVCPRGQGGLLRGGLLLGGGGLLWGVCSRGVPGPGLGGSASGGIPACTEADTPPPPTVDRHTLVKIFPWAAWPNFVAAGNKQSTQSETSEYYMKPDKNISAVVNYQFQLEYN